MTIQDVLSKIDAQKRGDYSKNEKIRWLDTLDRRVFEEVISTHEGGIDTFAGYNSETPLETVLLVGSPHDDIYLFWIECRIDYNNRDYGKYNNSYAAFSAAWNEFCRAYNRVHMPKTVKFKGF